MAYEQVAGPIGPARDDLRMGVMASMYAKVHGDKSAKPSDFVLTFNHAEPTQQELRGKLNAWRATHNAAVGRKRRK